MVLQAYYRRGSANLALGKFKIGLADFRKARVLVARGSVR